MKLYEPFHRGRIATRARIVFPPMATQALENRLRFLVRVLRRVRRAVQDFPIAIRFGGADYMEGGSTVEDAAAASRILSREGVDLLDLSGGLCVFHRPGHTEPGFFADMAEAVRAATDTPILLTGGIRRPEEAEHFLARGIGLIGVGRALLANPRWGAPQHTFE